MKTKTHCATCACSIAGYAAYQFIPKKIRDDVCNLHFDKYKRTYYSKKLGLSISYSLSMNDNPFNDTLDNYLCIDDTFIDVDKKRSPAVIKQIDHIREESWEDILIDCWKFDGKIDSTFYNILREEDKKFISSFQKKVNKVLDEIKNVKNNIPELEKVTVYQIVNSIFAENFAENRGETR